MKKRSREAVKRLCRKMQEYGDVFVSRGTPDRIFWKDGGSSSRSVFDAAVSLGVVTANADGLFDDTPQSWSVAPDFEARVDAASKTDERAT